MKKFLILTSLFLVAFATHGSAYDYLILAQSDGSRTALEAAGLKLTFTDGYLVATSASGDVTRTKLDDMRAMWFSETSTTGISTIESNQPTVVTNGNSLIAQAESGTSYTVSTLSGVVVSRGTLSGEAKETIASGLQKGIYVIKIREKNFKMQVR